MGLINTLTAHLEGVLLSEQLPPPTSHLTSSQLSASLSRLLHATPRVQERRGGRKTCALVSNNSRSQRTSKAAQGVGMSGWAGSLGSEEGLMSAAVQPEDGRRQEEEESFQMDMQTAIARSRMPPCSLIPANHFAAGVLLQEQPAHAGGSDTRP